MKKLLWLSCKFDLDQSERKSSQVNASARKAWPNGVASRPKFSTCVYLRRGSRSPDNAEFGHFTFSCFAEDGKEMYQELLSPGQTETQVDAS